MAKLPLVVELQSVDAVRSQLTYTLYFIDRTAQTYQGTLSDFEQHLLQAQQGRALGHKYTDLLHQKRQVGEQIKALESQLEAQQQQLPDLEQTTATRLQAARAESPVPQFDAALANSISVRERQGWLVGGVIVAGFGLMVFATSSSAMGRFLGGVLLLSGGVGTSVVYGKETNDSQEAERHRRLKQRAEEIERQLAALAQAGQAEVEGLKRQLARTSQQKADLQEQLGRLEGLVAIAKVINQINQRLGDGVLYGEPELMIALELMIRQREKDGDLAKGLAGAALVGLMVVGAFAGFGP